MASLSLLDTHVLIWAVAQPHRLNRDARDRIESNQYVASLWELLNKKGKPDAPVKDPVAWWQQYVTRPRTPVLPIRTEHVARLDRLPWHHKDPFDRILIAQATVEAMLLITNDPQIHRYPVDFRVTS